MRPSQTSFKFIALNSGTQIAIVRMVDHEALFERVGKAIRAIVRCEGDPDTADWIDARAAWKWAYSKLRILANSSIYWSDGGKIACSSHVPEYRSETWDWDCWRRISHDERAGFESEVGHPCRCQSCPSPLGNRMFTRAIFELINTEITKFDAPLSVVLDDEPRGLLQGSRT